MIIKIKTNKYDDIIDLPHHVSPYRPKMSLSDRAAQFSPFAALTGYEAAVEETARLTETKTEISEDMKTLLNEKIQIIIDNLDRYPEVIITHFVPDKKKSGGAYVDVAGIVKAVDTYERRILMADKTSIPIDQIREIEGEIFERLGL